MPEAARASLTRRNLPTEVHFDNIHGIQMQVWQSSRNIMTGYNKESSASEAQNTSGTEPFDLSETQGWSSAGG